MSGRDDAHDHGLQHDLQRMHDLARENIGRRRTLRLLFSVSGAALIGACGGGSASSGESTSTTTPAPTPTPTPTPTATGSCVADPEETNGPYPADGSNSRNGTVVNVLDDSGIVRGDIRSSFGSSTATASGLYTTLTITLVNVNGGCAPLAGYAIYIWHCDINGKYSLYDLPAENYLRGLGVTDANGQLTFTTIFAGCYDGRYPHIHFEVYPSLARATAYGNRILCSQFAMPAATCSTVYATSAYASSRNNFAGESISSDNVFGDNSAAQQAAMTIAMTGDITNGFTGTVTVGVAI
ncbi:intradiol ring-cleavage dioxygenase [Sphingobium sp.]|uniref:dioxygenase family protein n=1 Tax=Sphingobium sp. TaxID=1912891 RepID=UPI003B3B0C36